MPDDSRQPGGVFHVDLDVSRQHKQYEDKGFLPLDNHLARLEQVDYAKFYADSVEVIRQDGDKLFFRAWFGQRSDGSMAPGPDQDEF